MVQYMVSGVCLTAFHKTVVVIIITLSALLETDYDSTKANQNRLVHTLLLK